MATDIEDDIIDVQHQLVKSEQLPPEMMLMKMENESIMTVARAQPRNYPKIIKELTSMIDAYPEAADQAIYSKPVGTETAIVCGGCGFSYRVPYIGRDGVECPKCQSDKVKEERKVKKFAEGLSVRAAESIRSVFGFNRLAVTMEMLADGSAKLCGTFVDYSAGTITADQRIVSPFYTDRYKKQQRTPTDRFIGVLVKAEKSKLRRDIILDGVPNVVKAAYRDACEKKLRALISQEEIDGVILPACAKFGLTPENVEKILGRPISMGWAEEDRLQLRKILSALKNEETTVAELLADLDEDSPQQSTGTKAEVKPGPVSASDLTSPRAAQQESLQADGPAVAKEDSQVDPAELLADIKAEALRLADLGDIAGLKNMQAKYLGEDPLIKDEAAIGEISAHLTKCIEKSGRGSRSNKQKDLIEKGSPASE